MIIDFNIDGFNVLTITLEDDNTRTVDLSLLEALTSIDTVGQTIQYTDEDGNTRIADIMDLETLMSITDNGDGTFTYVDEDGVSTTIDAA